MSPGVYKHIAMYSVICIDDEQGFDNMSEESEKKKTSS